MTGEEGNTEPDGSDARIILSALIRRAHASDAFAVVYIVVLALLMRWLLRLRIDTSTSLSPTHRGGAGASGIVLRLATGYYALTHSKQGSNGKSTSTSTLRSVPVWYIVQACAGYAAFSLCAALTVLHFSMGVCVTVLVVP